MSEQNDVNLPPVDFLEQLTVYGLNIIMSGVKHSQTLFTQEYPLIRNEIFAKFPEILLPRLSALTCEIQTKIVEGIFSENPTILINAESGWWDYVNKSISILEEKDPKSFFEYTALYVLLNRVRDLKEEVNWYKVFLKLSDTTIESGSKCQGFMTVLNWLIQADPENLKNILYRTDSKSYPSNLKLELYRQSIDLGLFDVKIARRVRSDTSGSLSSEVLSYLFENRSVFKDSDFQDLVTQFSDTKHKWVARYIAINMPMHLVPFLMGIKDDVALKILEKRMEVSEK